MLLSMKMRQVCMITTLLLLWGIQDSPGEEGEAGPKIKIQLHTSAKVTESPVRFRDVATCFVMNEQISHAINALDLLELEVGRQALVSREFIKLRLDLAGINTSGLTFIGPRESLVQRIESSQTNTQRLESEIIKQLAEQFQRPVEDLRIRFLTPLPQLIKEEDRANEALAPEVVWSSYPVPGRSSLTIRLVEQRQVKQSITLPVHIEIRQQVVVVNRNMYQRSETLQSKDLSVTDIFTSQPSVASSPAQFSGMIAKRDFPIGYCLRKIDVAAPKEEAPREVVVYPRHAIRLIARHKNLQYVVPQAEAMQAGRVGQIIKVRNLQSQRIVNAKLVSATEAIVEIQ